jgi:hypothetical protein
MSLLSAQAAKASPASLEPLIIRGLWVVLLVRILSVV